ncbi:magnesium transporter [Altererythrobacter sp. B11]|uniref:CorA family divalent cation transporter n=1 Tax=Altererythrobacter sp. B11 TaxID=2060312 RepID=UPI000DC72E3B|nr:CorA family divalent cation transporter [Altererythrobacter sp. B11]BBC73452.1 magnesium transporter [Altererythrobacter sp. B11]
MGGFALAIGPAGLREAAPGQPDFARRGEFAWEHFELPDGQEPPLAEREDIPDIVHSALVATETRPRCDQIGDGALLNLRGPATDQAAGGDRLVSIRIWVRHRRVVSVSRRPLAATRAVADCMRKGELADPGDLVASFAHNISTELDPQIARLGDYIDDCETELQGAAIYRLRRRIAQSRADAIAFRRFIAPDRDALITLAGLRVEWLADEDRLHIREAADRFARMAEELEAIRERSALMHEQLTDLRAELIDQRSLSIAVVAFVFLPLTFVTGLLGMNVEGIPYAHAPWAFWGVVGFCILIGLVVLVWFVARHWLRD